MAVYRQPARLCPGSEVALSSGLVTESREGLFRTISFGNAEPNQFAQHVIDFSSSGLFRYKGIRGQRQDRLNYQTNTLADRLSNPKLPVVRVRREQGSAAAKISGK